MWMWTKSNCVLFIFANPWSELCVFLSWWLLVRTTIQHHCQAPRLGNGLLGRRDHLWRHHCWFLPAAQHPNQDGSHVQEGRLKRHRTWSSAPRGKLDTLSSRCVFIFFLLDFYITVFSVSLTGQIHKWKFFEVQQSCFGRCFSTYSIYSLYIINKGM